MCIGGLFSLCGLCLFLYTLCRWIPTFINDTKFEPPWGNDEVCWFLPLLMIPIGYFIGLLWPLLLIVLIVVGSLFFIRYLARTKKQMDKLIQKVQNKENL